MRNVFYFVLLILFANTVKAQESSRLQVSLITVSPGEELYSTFGHSALRIVDSNAVTDLIYNYGTFDFSDKNFYTKFIRGKLLYFLGVEDTREFLYNVAIEKRSATEQILDLSDQKKMLIRNAIIQNLQDSTRFYKYDFVGDNCTTRLRDQIEKVTDSAADKVMVMPPKTTFRNALHTYLDRGGQQWSKFGIDLLLGAKTDAVMTTRQQQFLPDNLMKALDASSDKIPITKRRLIPEANDIKASGGFTPLLIFGSLAVFIILLSFLPNKNTFYIIARTYLFVLGALGILLLFMWFGTDHSLTVNNYNLLWCIPLHVFMAFSKNKTSFSKYYWLITIVLNVILLAGMRTFLPQLINTAVIPLVIAEAYIAFRFYKNFYQTP